jgi:hypothetical protein
MAMTWKDWNPGLENDDQILGDVYKTIPHDQLKPSSPFIVRMFENPKSPLPLPGKCDLLRHDLIHVLLGRGLLLEDEAFVIGYTMGTSKTISNLGKLFYKSVSCTVYPKEYRFRLQDMTVYDLGFSAGQRNKIEIYDIEIENMLSRTVGEVRSSLGIDKSVLKMAFNFERAVTDSLGSSRAVAAMSRQPKMEFSAGHV